MSHKKKNSGTILLLTLLLSAAAILGILLLFFFLARFEGAEPPQDPLLGTRKRSIDLTEEFRQAARAYLSEARLGNTLDPSDYITELQVTLLLEFHKDGTYSLTVDKGSYLTAKKNAEDALEDAFTDLLSMRGKELGKSSVSKKEMEALFSRLTGKSFSEYMEEHDIALIPPLAELEAQYNASGAFRKMGELLEREGLSPAVFLCDEETLVLRPETGSGKASEPEVYTR